MSLPSVAVIISAYNHAPFVRDAVLSASHQDYPLRVVVVDDGSSDGTAQEVASLLDNVSRVGDWGLQGTVEGTSVPLHLQRLPQRRGASFARNIAMKACWDVDIFGILDADDAWNQGRVKRCVREFADPAVGMVYSDYTTVNTQTGLLIREYKEPYSRERLLQSCVATNACFLRKSALAEVGLYDEALPVAEDWDLFLRLSEKYVIAHVPESLVMIRVTGRNTTNTVAPEVWQASWARVAEKVRERGVF